MNIGYARISTIDQNLDLQLDALKQAGCEEVFTDKITGTKFDRPQLNELKKILRQGDTVVVWKMDRIDFPNFKKYYIILTIFFEKMVKKVIYFLKLGKSNG